MYDKIHHKFKKKKVGGEKSYELQHLGFGTSYVSTVIKTDFMEKVRFKLDYKANKIVY